ncbi:E3 ubiquitin-protein ligase BRE1A-like [Montipora foliosa]|uniref:E3 ubiquitin-protein ligase BRE1A-like n=3 Tax=Montipora TaxID=46703 RepID=UPI0035F13BD6
MVKFVKTHRPDFQATNYSALCSLHFSSSCFMCLKLDDLMSASVDTSKETVKSTSEKATEKRILIRGSISMIHCANKAPEIAEGSNRDRRRSQAYNSSSKEEEESMEEEEKEFTEEEDIECLEEPELEDTDEADPDWHCQLEENGDDIDADDEEKESASVNIISVDKEIPCQKEPKFIVFYTRLLAIFSMLFQLQRRGAHGFHEKERHHGDSDSEMQKLRSKAICVEVSPIGAWAIPSRKYPAKLRYSDGRGICTNVYNKMKQVLMNTRLLNDVKKLSKYVDEVRKLVFSMLQAERNSILSKYKTETPPPLNSQFTDKQSRAEAVENNSKRKQKDTAAYPSGTLRFDNGDGNVGHFYFRQSMKWTEEHEVVMLRELMLMQPWQHRKGTSERGDDWEKLAISLNAIPNPQFRVTQRSVRDHYSTMEKRRRKKVREEDRASGIAPEEDKELDQLLDEIMELFNESDKAIDETKQKQEEEVKKAEEMRKRSLETFKESAKRNGDEQQGAKQRKTRASGANTMAYLKERAETEATLKREKLEIKRKELVLQAKEQEGRQQQFDMMNKQTRDIQQLQQQQMQQFMQMNANMMQQHQQQTLALMELMRKFADK